MVSTDITVSKKFPGFTPLHRKQPNSHMRWCNPHMEPVQLAAVYVLRFCGIHALRTPYEHRLVTCMCSHPSTYSYIMYTISHTHTVTHTHKLISICIKCRTPRHVITKPNKMKGRSVTSLPTLHQVTRNETV